MTGRSQRSALVLVLVVVLVVVLAACRGGTTDRYEPPVADPPTEDPPTVAPPGDHEAGGDAPEPELPPLVADWEHDDVRTELPGGWTVAGCEGDAPLLCVTDADQQVGFLELGRYPLPATHDGDDGAYLAAAMDAFVEGMRADRAEGCPSLAFEPIPPADVVVGGEPGLRGGFRMVDDGGREVERHVVYWTVADGEHLTVTVPAYAADGCLEPMGEFTPGDLGLVAPYLDELVAQSPLPAVGDGPRG